MSKKNYNDDKILKGLSHFSNYSRCSYLGDLNRNVFLYKYLDFDIAKAIKNGENISLRFSQPKMWKDGFERRYYNANYDNVTKDISKHPNLYACCFTLEKVSEVAWLAYANKKSVTNNEGNSTYNINDCVLFKIRKSALRKALNTYANNNNCDIYEGEINYNHSFFSIGNLHHNVENNEDIDRCRKALFNDNFEINNYLSLLLLKRNIFKYEKEFRFFVVPRNGEMEDYIDIEIPIDAVEKLLCKNRRIRQISIKYKNAILIV